ncbi:FKBP-type peptidyl-prolyl cis-trans isomerase [Gilliamella apicola]|uniref:Peptidyl-prolyl cis-trans isomerase n=1 Tax=Gilliamella apicola TaxID=1196095 RepID=A0A2V4DQX9_9GAMM|nr:FKBP-type peptidyl-prolyl cis-trans isomerase [Gilliamella apicola]KES18846.1 FKBP-type peptidyl-prolyl cis-trans isomerase 1 [Gilliamella apicola SCGC AB-598-I20]PXZ02480.1 FKBP-type peptidyl-prolyl cis-trans isomerase [Gilliamella apicola]
MKSFIKMTLISSAIVLALAGCDDKKTTDKSKAPVTTTKTTTANTTENNSTPAPAKDDEQNAKIKITTVAQKESYALGSSFANYLKSNLEQNGVEADQEYLISGFNETMKNSSQFSQEEVNTILEAFGKRVQEESKARFEKQKAENTAAGEKFREEFAKEPGVIKTKSGLLYKVINEGTGPHPTENDTVIVHYIGTLTDGRKFDSSFDRNQTATFSLNGVIKGWTEGIQIIGVGGKIKLVVPPELAYGDQGFPNQGDKASITPASTLVFEIDLLGIDSDKEHNEETAPATDTE